MPSINYKHLEVHYTTSGTGPAVVLLHGFLEDLSMWDDLAPELSASYHVICIDLLGHGKTGNLGYVHAMEEQARMVSQVLDALQVEKPSLIGHSMGGYVALAFAELYPGAVRSLCLMNSTARADDPEKKQNRERGIRAVKKNHKTFVRLAIPNLFAEENRPRYAAEITAITKQSLKMKPQGIIAALEGMKIRSDRTQVLKGASFPIQMIIGKQDPALPYDSLREQAGIPGVHAVIFSDGHMSHIENKKALLAALQEFLQKS